MPRRMTVLALTLAVGLTVATLAPGAGAVPGAGGTPKCPVNALDKVDEPVEITFWYTQQGENNKGILLDLLEQFEASQDKVRVNAIDQVVYSDLFEKYKAGLDSGKVPDLAQMEDTTVQSLVDSQSTIPMESCVEADDYDLSDFLPRALDFYTTEGVLRAMPWTVSNIILYYNKNAFRAAGLDPDDPPGTFEEITEYSRQIVESGAARYGLSVWAEPYVNEFLFAKSGQVYVNNGNGRKQRATEARIDSDKGLQIWQWWDEMVDSGLALYTGSTPASIDHLLAIGTGEAAMTFDASSGLGPVFDILGQGQYAGVEMGVGPLPSLKGGGGVPVGDASLWIPDSGSNVKVAAAWELVKFLSSPEAYAAFTVGTRGGFVPIREASFQDPAVQQLYAENPQLQVPYDQLQAGGTGAAAVGPVIGDYAGVRNAVRDALTEMFANGMAPKQALQRAQQDADDAIESYNERIGA
ncbi:MAG TPA: ABC transporter substrate-binding protein [Acidimicrobiia bacterium]